MTKSLATVLLVLFAFGLPAAGYGGNVDGVWEAKYMGAKIRATIEQMGDQVKGVAKIHSPGGKKDTYHFSGYVRGNEIRVAHYTGHSFAGNLTRPGLMQGVLTTRDGHSVSISASKMPRTRR